MERSIFSMRLIQLRKDKHLTQADMADILGLSRSSYTCYEIGTSTPTMTTLIELADLFKVSLDYLVGRGEDPAMYSTDDPIAMREELNLTDRFRRMTPEKRRALKEMAVLFTQD
ncbi:MAG: helix-turn-helix transcriptional regulator [Clostridia bacterium]|nr:helix-turn-helix transcriptional regulator [Clostridia bacterium]